MGKIKDKMISNHETPEKEGRATKKKREKSGLLTLLWERGGGGKKGKVLAD